MQQEFNSKFKNKILQGDALTVLKTLPSESIDCICTSPPYWALRDYKVDGQIGIEKTIDEYIDKLILVFNECKRVLKKEGTCWVVLGDTYAGHKGDMRNPGYKDKNEGYKYVQDAVNRRDYWITEAPEKSLSLIPERFSLKMIENNWILRNKIIWYKPNCMPSSAKDRFTVDFENIYFFTKSQKYYFNTQYEPLSTNPSGWRKSNEVFGGKKHEGYGNPVYSGNEYKPNRNGRIKRCVWDGEDIPPINEIWKINTKPFPEAHFAVFPEELVKQCLDAGCPSEICRECGKSKIIEYFQETPKWERKINEGRNFNRKIGQKYQNWLQEHPSKQNIISCNCDAGFESGIVLDIFMGSGTVALVALKNAMNFVGIELNPDYITMAQKRIEPYLKQEKLTQFTK